MFKRCFIESFIDVGSGLILAILIQLYIFPFFWSLSNHMG